MLPSHDVAPALPPDRSPAARAHLGRRVGTLTEVGQAFGGRTASLARDLLSSRRAQWRLCAGALVASAVFLLAHLDSYPIVMWDESRLAVNALEMYLTGPALVTTYNFEPDLWNTKPPLAVWLMAGSMGLFGPSEWALRLPSALSAVATLAVIMAFSWKLTRSAPAVVLTCVLLVTSSGFYGRHAAATADYDSLLTLFTTSYVCLLFGAVHRRKPRPGQVLAAGGAITAAILTKGVAGLIPGVGIVVYLLLVGRIARPMLTPRYLATAAIIVSAAVAFYGLREAAEPGYLQAVLQNELAGRYLSTIAGEHQPAWYFAKVIVESNFVAGPLLVLLPLGLYVARGRVRVGILFATCIVFGIVLVFSSSATKLRWYIVPAYPFLAAGMALSISALARTVGQARRADQRDRWVAADTLVLVLSALILVIGSFRYVPVSRHYGGSQGHYGFVFAELHSRGIHTVDVVEGGNVNTEGFVQYAPRLRFYTLLWRMRSFHVREIARDPTTVRRTAGDIVVTCDPRHVNNVRALGTPVGSVRGCMSVRQ